MLIWRSSRTSVRELGYDPAAGVFHAAARHEDVERVPGVLVLRVDGPLFFADADHFRDRMRDLALAHPDARRLVVDAEAIHLTDTDGADVIAEGAEALARRDVTLALANVHPPVLALWEKAGVFDVVDRGEVHETVADAVGGDFVRSG